MLADGVTLPGASVRAIDPWDRVGPPLGPPSGGDGIARGYAPLVSPTVAVVACDGYASRKVLLDPEAGVSGLLDVALSPSSAVLVRVEDPDGGPASGVVVVAELQDTLRATGRASAPGEYVVTARASDVRIVVVGDPMARWRTAVVEAARLRPADGVYRVRLQRAVAWKLEVLDRSSFGGVAGARVTVPSLPELAPVLADSEGRVEWPHTRGVPIGALVVAPGYAGEWFDDEVLEKSGGKVLLRPVARIRGVVRENGSPLAGVCCSGDMQLPFAERVETDAKGAYRLDSLAPEERSVRFEHPSFGVIRVALRREWKGGELHEVDCDATIRVVRGRVERPPGAPDTPVVVRAETVFAVASADGAFELRGALAPHDVIRATAEGLAGFAFLPDTDDGVVVRLHRLGRVAGTVAGGGKGVVLLLRAPGSGLPGDGMLDVAHPASDGAFEFRGVPADLALELVVVRGEAKRTLDGIAAGQTDLRVDAP